MSVTAIASDVFAATIIGSAVASKAADAAGTRGVSGHATPRRRQAAAPSRAVPHRDVVTRLAEPPGDSRARRAEPCEVDPFSCAEHRRSGRKRLAVQHRPGSGSADERERGEGGSGEPEEPPARWQRQDERKQRGRAARRPRHRAAEPAVEATDIERLRELRRNDAREGDGLRLSARPLGEHVGRKRWCGGGGAAAPDLGTQRPVERRGALAREAREPPMLGLLDGDGDGGQARFPAVTPSALASGCGGSPKATSP
jgi:hypothetical protein